MRWQAGCAITVLVLVSACASPGGARRTSSSPVTTGSIVSSPASLPDTSRQATSNSGGGSGNKEAARAEADRLVTAVDLPPGAHRTSRGPSALPGPAMGTPATSQLIDTTAFYRVPLSLPQARAWFQSHSQHGLPQEGSSSGTGPAGVTSFGFEWDATPKPQWAWGTADLQVGLVGDGSTATAVRVDGLALWIDPTPARDTAHGRRIRLTAAGRCPASDRGVSDIDNPGQRDLDRQLLPDAAPTAGLECVYRGLNGAADSRVRSRRLSAEQAAVAAHRIRALPLGQSGDGPHSCPADFGSATILVFSYRGRPDVDIWQHTTGCEYTDNGHITSGRF